MSYIIPDNGRIVGLSVGLRFARVFYVVQLFPLLNPTF